MTSEAFAPAKVNLTLHVTGQRADGYHLLDSIVVFAEVGDQLTFTAADETSLCVAGQFAEGVPQDRRNTVLRAADLVGASHQITLKKNLPHGAGIGGGSADAAAVLRYFGKTDGALELGADVPVCLMSTAQRMRGVGEQLNPLTGWPACPAILVNPGVHVATPLIFKALKRKDNPPMPEALPSLKSAADLIAWLPHVRNDLEPPAIELTPKIRTVLLALSAVSPFARMSGSGATCFGLFETMQAATEAAQKIAREHPYWWVQSTMLS